LNSLLSIHFNEELLSDRECNFNGFNDSYDDIDNKLEELCGDDDSHSHNRDDALLTGDYSHSNAYRHSPLRSNLANRRFEIMLFLLIMTHRASLAMFDDNANLWKNIYHHLILRYHHNLIT
jgi:hypothetical protein